METRLDGDLSLHLPVVASIRRERPEVPLLCPLLTYGIQPMLWTWLR